MAISKELKSKRNAAYRAKKKAELGVSTERGSYDIRVTTRHERINDLYDGRLDNDLAREFLRQPMREEC